MCKKKKWTLVFPQTITRTYKQVSIAWFWLSNSIMAMLKVPRGEIKTQRLRLLAYESGCGEKKTKLVSGDKLLWIVTGTGSGEGNTQFPG